MQHQLRDVLLICRFSIATYLVDAPTEDLKVSKIGLRKGIIELKVIYKVFEYKFNNYFNPVGAGELASRFQCPERATSGRDYVRT